MNHEPPWPPFIFLTLSVIWFTMTKKGLRIEAVRQSQSGSEVQKERGNQGASQPANQQANQQAASGIWGRGQSSKRQVNFTALLSSSRGWPVLSGDWRQTAEPGFCEFKIDLQIFAKIWCCLLTPGVSRGKFFTSRLFFNPQPCTGLFKNIS